MGIASKVGEELLSLLICPDCRGKVRGDAEYLICIDCGRKFMVEDGIPIMLPSNVPKEELIAIDTWGREYRGLLRSRNYQYLDRYGLKDYEILNRSHNFSSRDRFLELGCGRARVCLMLSKDGVTTIGLDVSMDALRLGQEIFRQHNARGFFVCGDMLSPPLKGGSFDMVFGGGSLEHLKDTETCIKRVHELTKPAGKFMATVPYVSLSTLAQGLLTGNIPDVLFLREVYTFVHFKIMRRRSLLYGFEKSFTGKSITKSFSDAGFRDIELGLYDVEYTLKFFPYPPLRRIIQRLIRIRLFWPAVYVCGQK